jgi:pentatricopeptide repeat protein
MTSNSLIDEYCIVGNIKKAFTLPDAMVSVDIEPHFVTYIVHF